MVNVFNRIERVGGDPLPGISVTISLVWDNTVQPFAFDTTDDTVVRTSLNTSTNELGVWSAMLVPNDLIEPAGSVYRVLERSSMTEDPITYFIDVDSNSIGDVWVGDILTVDPGW